MAEDVRPEPIGQHPHQQPAAGDGPAALRANGRANFIAALQGVVSLLTLAQANSSPSLSIQNVGAKSAQQTILVATSGSGASSPTSSRTGAPAPRSVPTPTLNSATVPSSGAGQKSGKISFVAGLEGGSPATQQMVFMYLPGQKGAVPAHAPYEVALMNLDGTDLKQLTNDGKAKFLPHFSPDGTKILYTKFAVGGYASPTAATDVAVYDLASGKETMVTSGGNNGYGTWSPDGSRIAYINGARLGNETGTTTLMTIDADGSNPQTVGAPSGAPDDWIWSDIAWSRDNWILIGVATTVNGTFCKSRLDKIRPDGSSRTQVSDGGTSCTPPGVEAIGDADPGWSSDSQTIYSSRGFPVPPANAPPGSSERKLYAFSSDAWTSDKVYHDLSFPSEPSCIEGVPTGSPDGKRILLFRACFGGTGVPVVGIYVTDTAGSYRTFITKGFGPDWNPVAK
jgi:hypothetical protein